MVITHAVTLSAPAGAGIGQNGVVSDAAFDEFSFLPAQADAIGVPVPPVRRVTHRLADGRTVSALRYGDPAAPVEVTFLHGAGLNAHTWDTTVLHAGLAALVVDLPGHGDSAWRDDAQYTGRTLAADVEPAIREWADGRAQVLVGHSLGGLTAASLAARHPELVRELVLVDISPASTRTGQRRRSARSSPAPPTGPAARNSSIERSRSAWAVRARQPREGCR